MGPLPNRDSCSEPCDVGGVDPLRWTVKRLRWYEQQRAGLGQALIGELEEWLALAVVRPNAGTIVGATRRGGPHVRWSTGKRRNGWLEFSAFGTIESP